MLVKVSGMVPGAQWRLAESASWQSLDPGCLSSSKELLARLWWETRFLLWGRGNSLGSSHLNSHFLDRHPGWQNHCSLLHSSCILPSHLLDLQPHGTIIFSSLKFHVCIHHSLCHETLFSPSPTTGIAHSRKLTRTVTSLIMPSSPTVW